MKKRIILLSLLLAGLTPAWAQDTNLMYQRGQTYLENTLPPSPEPASATKYADIPFSHGLGMAELSIPIYTLKGRELSIPVSLDYRSGGIKVDEVAGVAGLGWTLNAGGCITREVMYMPDEYNNWSFYQFPSDTMLSDLISLTNNTNTINYLKSILWRQVDVQPDRYRYNFCGLSGSFIITPDQDVVHLTDDGVLIEFDATNDAFHLTGPDGTRYDFTERERGTRSQVVADVTPMTGQQVNWTATTAWYLTAISSRTGLETATLTYSSAGTWNRDSYLSTKSWSQRIPSGLSPTLTGPTGSLTTVQSSYQTKVLSQISMNDYHILFDYSTAGGYGSRKGPGTYSAQNFPKRLSEITVRYGSLSEIARWTVTTASSQDNRIMLTGLQEYCENELHDRWTFTYIQHGGSSRYSQDWYGYYNAETGRTSVCPYSVTAGSGNASVNLLYGTPDPQYADDMMLSTMDHDGAKTEFEYEGNAIPLSGSSALTYVGVRVKKIKVKDGNTQVRVRNFTYSQPASTNGHEPTPGLYTRVNLTRDIETVGFDSTISVDIWDYTMHETPVLEGPSLQETRVVYGQVTEEVTGPDITSGSARTVYHYDTQRAKDGWNNQIMNRFPTAIYSDYSAHNVLQYVDQAYVYPGTGEPGLLTRKEEYKYENGSYAMASSEDISYTTRTGQDVFAGYTVHQVNYGINAAGGNALYTDFYHYPVYMTKVATGKPSKKVRVQYHSSGNDTLTVSLGYHSANRLGSLSVAEDNHTRRTLYYIYPDAASGNTAWSALVSQNAIAVPVARSHVRYKEVTINNISGWVEASNTREETTYGNFTVDGSSVLLPSGKEERRDGTLAWSESILSYDKLGRPTSVKAQGAPQTVILWSYKGLHPVAVIENATIGDVTAAFTGGASGLASLAGAGEPSTTQLTRVNALRTSLSSAHVTTYTFDAMLGVVKSKTDPAGITTTYEYDGAGRLTAVKDKDGKLVDGYEYDLLDMDGDGLRSMTHKAYRTNTGSVYAEDLRYWNRLGLLKEDISIGASGNGSDLVAAYEGDCLLHDDVRAWMPYPVSNTGGNFQTGAPAAAAAYHGNNKAYDYKRYELSSRDRQVGAAVPGYQGVHESPVADDVTSAFPKLLWNDTGGVTTIGTYATSEIVKQIQNDADGRKTVSYTDQVGRLLATGLVSQADTVTLRVYDDHDRLRAVIGAGIALTDTLNMWRYSYDAKGRISSKGIPGCSREGYVYDAEDRITAIDRTDGLTSFTYDAFGRVTKVQHLSTGNVITILENHTYDTPPTAAKTLMQTAGQPYNWSGPTKGFELYCKKAELNGSGGVTGNAETAMRYDAFGRLACRVTKYPDGGLLTELFTYTFPGEVATRTTRYKRGSSTDELTETMSYDIRGRLSSVTSSLKVAGTTVGTDNTSFSYDALGRTAGESSTATGGITLSTTDAYTLQGWRAGRSVTRGTTAVFSETLSYDSASALSHASPSYTGMITKKYQVWGSGSPSSTEEYAYDTRGRLAHTWNGSNHDVYGYDVRGNRNYEKSVHGSPLPTTTQYSYVYQGDRLKERSRLNYGDTFAYDALGRMVRDTTSSHASIGGGTQTDILSLTYNQVGMTQNISKNGSLLVKYLYLADGMKTSAQHSDGSGLVYRGPFVYGRSSGGTLTFGSAAFAGGRITSAGVQYHVTDHLGSVVAVVNGSDGSVVESGKYADFGDRTDIVSAGTPTAATNRWHFSGKEDQDVDFDLPFTDFGARLYNPNLGRWITPDPASEKYYDISPYAYCANNPVILVDPDGEAIRVWDPDEKKYYSYHNGRVYDSDGKEYNGNNQFVRMIESSINKLYALNDEYINEVLLKLEDSPQEHLIVPGKESKVQPTSEYGKSLANEGTPVDTFVLISSDTSPKDGTAFSQEVIVAHELKHAYDYNEGYYQGIIPWNWDNGIDPAEISAVNFENRVRVRTKMRIRTRYSLEIPAHLLEDPRKKKTDKK